MNRSNKMATAGILLFILASGILECFGIKEIAEAGTKEAAGFAAGIPSAEETHADILIIGSGGAGLSAAIAAADKGSKVVIVEKNATIGGNTRFANGMSSARTGNGMSAEESEEAFFRRTMAGGHYLNNPELVRILAGQSANAADWIDSLTRAVATVPAGKEEESAKVSFGSRLVGILQKNCELRGIDIRTNSKATGILSENGRISGIEVERPDGSRYRIKAKALILAGGGFGANRHLITRYNPALKGFKTTGQPGATGDILQLTEHLQVALVDMEQIQTHPTVVAGKQTTITEGVRGAGAILLNRSGKRFVNELSTRDTVSKAILENGGGTAFLVFDSKVVEKLSLAKQYVSEAYTLEDQTVEGLAAKAGIPVAEAVHTLNQYNAYAENRKDEAFGRSRLSAPIDKPPFFAIEVSPAVHYTMGGIKINTKTEVIDRSGNIIPGLFAAGEVTGGIHGGNRLGGNSIADIIVFGRIAGEKASDYVRLHSHTPPR
ncbi:MAG: flavocytochrome c [Tannerellaceae bacterium]|jgi:fumarate reductase flavoprotein subunit|nr:flavocytochrome c [Tannerellaceae bacterium]